MGVCVGVGRGGGGVVGDSWDAARRLVRRALDAKRMPIQHLHHRHSPQRRELQGKPASAPLPPQPTLPHSRPATPILPAPHPLASCRRFYPHHGLLAPAASPSPLAGRLVPSTAGAVALLTLLCNTPPPCPRPRPPSLASTPSFK